MLLPAAGSYRNLRRRRCTGELTPACCQQNASPDEARLRHRWPVVTAVAWHHFMLAPLPRGHLNPHTIRPLQAPPVGCRFRTARAPCSVAKLRCWCGCMREALRPAFQGCQGGWHPSPAGGGGILRILGFLLRSVRGPVYPRMPRVPYMGSGILGVFPSAKNHLGSSWI